MLFEFSDSILKELKRLIIKSRGKHIRIIILIVPGDKAPRINSYIVRKPIQLPRMLPIEIREIKDLGYIVTKSYHELSYADILENQN